LVSNQTQTKQNQIKMGKQKLNQRALLKFLLDSSEDEGRRGSKREVSDDEDVGPKSYEEESRIPLEW
jgi:hypothetical protein